MGVLETAARIVELGGSPARAQRVAAMRARFEERTGAFAPEDPWFEERSRAFWCDVVTSARFGREVEEQLGAEHRGCLGALERAHRGLFRTVASESDGDIVADAWSGAELLLTTVDESSREELAASSGQLFDARVVGTEDPYEVALLPGAIFHARDASAAIPAVLAAAHARGLTTDQTLDALLRMERNLRSLSRVKAAYAYRPDALAPHAPALPVRPASKSPT
ncbi:MAG TPA: hypothetical protein VIY73_05075 [Polyangiaceae bacterium]